jgi:DNA-binding CsgD family transcriptional regulator
MAAHRNPSQEQKEMLETQAALAGCDSLAEFVDVLRRRGCRLVAADDIEVTIMEMPRADRPGKTLFQSGGQNYTSSQLSYVHARSHEHPLFAMAAQGELPGALEPEDVAGRLGWRDTGMWREVYRPSDVIRTLFVSFRVLPGINVHLKAVRQHDLPFGEEERYRLLLLQSLAIGLFRRNHLLAALCRVLRAAYRDDTIVRRLGPELFALGPREAEVLAWVEAGKQDAEIATILGISPRTVHAHVRSLLGKLHCENRLQLIASRFSQLFPLTPADCPRPGAPTAGPPT